MEIAHWEIGKRFRELVDHIAVDSFRKESVWQRRLPNMEALGKEITGILTENEQKGTFRSLVNILPKGGQRFVEKLLSFVKHDRNP